MKVSDPGPLLILVAFAPILIFGRVLALVS